MSQFFRFACAAIALVGLSAAAAPAMAADAVVVVNLQRLYAESDAGKSAQAQLKSIGDNAQKELDPEAKALQAETDATWAPRFQGKSDQQLGAELEKDPALKTKYVAYVQRRNALVQKTNLRSNELQATAQAASQAVVVAALPDVKGAMAAKGASVVLEKDSVLWATDAVDITTDVLNRFNARVKTVPVTKVDLTQQQK